MNTMRSVGPSFLSDMRRKHKLLLFTIGVLVLVAPITAQSQKRSSYVILLDNTGSMTTQFSQVQALAKTVVKRLHQDGPISILIFERQGNFAVASLGIEREQDEDKLTNYIDGVSIVRAPTTLFDAVASAADILLDQTKASADTKKTLILITDGEDRVQRATSRSISFNDEEDRWRKARDQLVTKLKQAGITTYAIGLLRELGDESSIRLNPRQKAESFLTKVAKQTGGRVVISTSKKIDVDKIVADTFGP